MSPLLLRRARWAYAGVGLSCGRARVSFYHPPGVPREHQRKMHGEVTRTTIRGMSTFLSGPGGPV